LIFDFDNDIGRRLLGMGSVLTQRAGAPHDTSGLQSPSRIAHTFMLFPAEERSVAMSSVVSLEASGRVGLILIDNPPVNASSAAVRAGLRDALKALLADDALDAGVVACEGSTFVAGADIREFGKPAIEPHLPDVIAALEASSKPIVAALHGSALGGGFEIALGCHARVAAATAVIGLPEVTLGIIPGAGGTQRTPRLAGMMAALDLAGSGRRIKAPEALSMGLVDLIAPGDLRQAAIAHALSLVGTELKRASRLSVPARDVAAFEAAAAKLIAKARGQRSPERVVEALRIAATMPFEDGIKAERAIFIEERDGEQSAALRYAFFAEREVAKAPRLAGIAPRPVKTVGVIGAGTMGAGIAAALSENGFPVLVVETNEAAADAGRGRVSALFERQARSGRISDDEAATRIARVSVGTDFAALSDADLIIEAAFEDMAVKIDLFSRLSRIAKPGAVLATNTSYLDVDAIAEASGRPEDVVGLHFFSPANVMRLVEVVVGAKSAPEAAATALDLAKKLRKLPVVCGVCDGFVGNRMLVAWRAVAECALEDGLSATEIDGAMERFGFAMGPFAVMDLAGLDIGYARRRRLDATRNPKARYAATIADRLVEAGRLGQKTGLGFYAYEAGKRRADPAVDAIVSQVRVEKGTGTTAPLLHELAADVHAAMVNEGAKILEEGIVARALDIDVALVHGYGFPAWRGGPMFEADRIGLRRILERVLALQARLGAGAEPAPLLTRLAASADSFSSWSG
jgi:3-hydroxyacyl-CoA dehydrogenase